jgi:DNA-binding LacI/PurR family transcriptional regulator
VSRAFTEGASISNKTKEKVLEAARHLGYQPSILPRILVTHNSQLIAIVIGGMYNPYYAKVFELFTRRFQDEGYQVLVFFVDHNEYFDDALPLIMRYRVDGIISALSLLSPEAALECARMDVPVVTFNGRRQPDAVSSVCCDNIEGGRQVATLLHARGGRRFAYVSGRESVANTDRQKGYLDRLGELGMTDVQVVQGDFHYEGGYRAAEEIMAMSPARDAIFCANDLMAIGVEERLRSEFSLRIPEDVMVVGFDDAVFSQWPSASLTTVRQNAEAMVDRTLQVLRRYWSGEPNVLGCIEVVAGQLIERKSTARQAAN